MNVVCLLRRVDLKPNARIFLKNTVTIMKFEIDKQTTNDLSLFDNVRGEKSVFSLFNFTKSIGGRKRLEYMFSKPLTDIGLITKRIQDIKSCRDSKENFDIDKENLDFIEHYLAQQGVSYKFSIIASYLNELKYRDRRAHV